MANRWYPRVAVVTGASAGIGEATARLFARQGMNLVLNARRKDRLEGLTAELSSHGVSVLSVPGDVCDPSVQQALYEQAKSLGGCEVLVNNAGFGQAGPMETVTLAHARRQLEVNTLAPFALASLVLPGMRERGAGRIIQVSSVLGRMSIPWFGWYNASKHALEAASDSLRMEVHRFGVRVVLIEPGPIATEFGSVATQSASLDSSFGTYHPRLAAFFHKYVNTRSYGTKAQDAARVILRAALASRPRVAYRITPTSRVAAFGAWLLPRRALDVILRRMFGT